MDYAVMWRLLRAAGYDELEQAASFYSKSPDGQYDELAALALRAVIAQMRQDDRAVPR